MRKIWMRLGVQVEITEAEEKTIFEGDSDCAIAEIVQSAVAEGRFVLDGDSYIPGICVEDFNRKYGTAYEPEDIDFDC